MRETSTIINDRHRVTFTVHGVVEAGTSILSSRSLTHYYRYETTRYDSEESDPISIDAKPGFTKFIYTAPSKIYGKIVRFAVKQEEYYIMPMSYLTGMPDAGVLRGLRKLGLLKAITFYLVFAAWIPWMFIVNVLGLLGGYQNHFYGYQDIFLILLGITCATAVVVAVSVASGRDIVSDPIRWIRRKCALSESTESVLLLIPTWCLKSCSEAAAPLRRIWVIREVAFADDCKELRFQHDVAFQVGGWRGSSPWSPRLPPSAMFESLGRSLGTHLLVGQNALLGEGPWFSVRLGQKTVSWGGPRA